MTDVVLIHHVLGVTPGVKDFAERLRRAGHTVTVPDLYDGATFTNLDEGMAHADSIGMENLMSKAGAAVSGGAPVVFAGFSLGAMAAHQLAQTRPDARGALLYHHGDVPLGVFDLPWPIGVDLQIHVSEGDEFREAGVPEEFVAEAGKVARAELFVYPGGEHLFADSSLPGYSAESTATMLKRSLEFLKRVGHH